MPAGADDDHVTHCIQFTMEQDDREWITERLPAACDANFYSCVEVPASHRSSEPITSDGRRYTKFYTVKQGDPWLPASFDYHRSRQALFSDGYQLGLAAGRSEPQPTADGFTAVGVGPAVPASTTQELFAKIDALLDGIDRHEDGPRGGWWQTPDGARIGRIKLRELKELIASHLATPPAAAGEGRDDA